MDHFKKIAMKKIAAYIVLALAGLLGACQDDEAFKIPTAVSFEINMNRNASTNSRLNFIQGHMTLASFSFDGRREEGGDTYFTKPYEEGLLLSFDAGNVVDALKFQIPQGNYTRIEVALETYDDDSNTSGLVVTGWYLHSNGTQYPVRFELGSSIDFEIEAREQSGNTQILLRQSKTARAKITLDQFKWF